MHNIDIASLIAGGSGTNTITASGFTVTQQQRDQIFADTSMEKLVDSVTTCLTPYPPVAVFPTNDSGASSNRSHHQERRDFGTGDSHAVVTQRVDNMAAGTVTADRTGHWPYTPTGLADGAHSVAASERNIGGYTRISTVNFTLDTVAPTTSIALSTDTGLSSGDRITSNAAISGPRRPMRR